MKWLGMIGILFLVGCQDGALEPDISTPGASGGSKVVDPNAKSFVTQPNELKTVLTELRAKTGWKLTCDPNLDHELVYLKFKDKTEREIAQALGQVLLANYPEKDGAMTLSSTHAAQINKILFQNEIYRGRIMPQLEEFQKLAATTNFATGHAAEKLAETVKRYHEIERSTSLEDMRLRQVMAPAGRATTQILSLVPEEEFATLEVSKPRVWATNPTGDQMKMTPQMEQVVDEFITKSIEWNGAAMADSSKIANLPATLVPPSFSPRSDFEFKMERGNEQISDTSTLACQLSTKAEPGFGTILSHIEIKLDPPKVATAPKADPEFEKLVQDLIGFRSTYQNAPSDQGPTTKDFNPGQPEAYVGDLRLKLLEITLECSADHSENIVANLSGEVLDQMVRLSMSNRILSSFPLNPDNLLMEHHAKFPGKDFVQYRPLLTVYARLDREFWIKRGSGVTNSPFSRPASNGSGIVKGIEY
jgi:uncharacterized protein YggL (DUF469 family)